MRLLSLVLLLWAASALADDGSPHVMINAQGKTDDSQCSFCHEADLTLSRSKTETCTMCHAITVHAGSAEHMAASADSVKQVLGDRFKAKPRWPLTDDGQIYCGTCHLFHDPRVMDDKWLPEARIANPGGVAAAIRDSLPARWDAEIERAQHKKTKVGLSTAPTRALRARADDGSLCRHCHLQDVK